jgi:hypothetical protein
MKKCSLRFYLLHIYLFIYERSIQKMQTQSVRSYRGFLNIYNDMAPLLGLRTSGVPYKAQAVDKSKSGQLLKFDNHTGDATLGRIFSNLTSMGHVDFAVQSSKVSTVRHSIEIKNHSLEFLANCLNSHLVSAGHAIIWTIVK